MYVQYVYSLICANVTSTSTGQLLQLHQSEAAHTGRAEIQGAHINTLHTRQRQHFMHSCPDMGTRRACCCLPGLATACRAHALLLRVHAERCCSRIASLLVGPHGCKVGGTLGGWQHAEKEEAICMCGREWDGATIRAYRGWAWGAMGMHHCQCRGRGADCCICSATCTHAACI